MVLKCTEGRLSPFFQIVRRFLAITGLMLVSSAVWAQWKLNMPRGVTAQSREIYDLHMLIFWICVVIGVLVYAVMIWSLVFHRKKDGAKAAQFSHNKSLEIVWTVIPTLILIAIAIPSTITLARIYDTSPGDINIVVTGLQWKWKYEYQEDGIEFISTLRTPDEEISGLLSKGEYYLLDVDKPLYVPTGARVRFLVTSDDVIHSFWVPDLGVKMDAVPGLINVTWAKIDEPGVYRGVCAELCGLQHGFMPIVVVAVEPEEYQAWVDERRVEEQELFEATGREWTKPDLLEQGEQVFNQYCAACHLVSGQGVPGAFPALVGSPNVLTGTPEKVVNTVLYGVTGTAMQAFSGQLGAVDLASAITYVRNAWGNDAETGGDIVQPKQIYELLQAEGG